MPPKYENKGEVDETLVNLVRKNSYLYQSKSKREGDGLKTVPYSDMVNKEMLFKIIDNMESGTNLFQLENLLQCELEKYKDSFTDEISKIS